MWLYFLPGNKSDAARGATHSLLIKPSARRMSISVLLRRLPRLRAELVGSRSDRRGSPCWTRRLAARVGCGSPTWSSAHFGSSEVRANRSDGHIEVDAESPEDVDERFGVEHLDATTEHVSDTRPGGATHAGKLKGHQVVALAYFEDHVKQLATDIHVCAFRATPSRMPCPSLSIHDG
jgi:hypothetical protein